MATAAEISEYDIDELETRLNETRRELFNLRFQLATGQLDNFSRLGHVKKDVARMLTELRAREIAEAEGLAVDDLPVHKAAARGRAEDEALGRTRTTAAERRETARADAAGSDDVADDDAATSDAANTGGGAAHDNAESGAAADNGDTDDGASDNVASDDEEEQV
jgi:large subunit ribosomal protein L29